MFLKVFRVKSSTAIRGSDRRKLRSEVSNAFTRLSQEEISEIVPNKEEMTVTRILTHSGQNVVVYCLNGEPVFFEVEKKIIPTVYTLWKFPDMLPSFTTWPPVFDKLKGGADLMLPGVIIPPAGITTLGSFDKGTVCSVCLNGNRAPVAVGTTLVSSRDLLEDGMRGKGVMVLHVYLDLLWAHGSKTLLPQLDVTDFQAESEEQNEPEHDDTDEKEGNNPNNLVPEESLVDDTAKLTIAEEGDLSARQNELENAVGTSSVKTDLKDEADGEPNDRFHPTPDEVNLAEEEDSLGTNVESQELQEGDDAMSRGSPFENMDDLLEYCFFCALLRMKKVELPVLTSTFFRTYLLPSCPDGSSVDIKKSSYKKLSKFLQCMQEKLVITVQEASKGVDQISAIAWHHPELKSFKSLRPAVESAATPQSDPAPSGSNPHPPAIEELLSVSAALLPVFSEFGVRKGAVLTHSDVRSTMTNYVKSHELVSSGNKRMVVLNPTLTRILIKKNEDIELLAWDELFERVSGKMNKCHQITIHGQQPVLRKGKIDAIEIKVEQRMGNKKVTLIRKLDSYGIDPQDFAHNVQIKAACSTSVTQLPGKAPTPGMQVLVQGNQVAIVAKCLLDEYKIPKKYITGLDLLKSSKKKKGEK